MFEGGDMNQDIVEDCDRDQYIVEGSDMDQDTIEGGDVEQDSRSIMLFVVSWACGVLLSSIVILSSSQLPFILKVVSTLFKKNSKLKQFYDWINYGKNKNPI